MLEKTLYPDDANLKLKIVEAEVNGYYYQPVNHDGKLNHYKLLKKNDKKDCGCHGKQSRIW